MNKTVQWTDQNGVTFQCPKYLTKHVEEKFYPNLIKGEVFANTIKSFNSLEWDNPDGLMSDDFEARNKLDISVSGDTKKLVLPGLHISVSKSMQIGRLQGGRTAGINDWAYCVSAGKYDVDRHRRLVFGGADHGYSGNPLRTYFVVYKTLPLLQALVETAKAHPLFAVQEQGQFLKPVFVTYTDDQTVHAKIMNDSEAKMALADAYQKATSFKPLKFQIEEEFRIIMSFKSPLLADWDSAPVTLQSAEIANSICDKGMLAA